MTPGRYLLKQLKFGISHLCRCVFVRRDCLRKDQLDTFKVSVARKASLLRKQITIFADFSMHMNHGFFATKVCVAVRHDEPVHPFGERLPCNLPFADDIDLMDSISSELQDLSNRFVERTTAYGIEVSTEESKVMTDRTNRADISMNGRKLKELTSFNYLGATLSIILETKERLET